MNIVKPKSKTEDKKRREFILNILLICSIVLYGIASIFSLYRLISWPGYDISNLIIIGVLFIVFISLYLISRIGFFNISAYILILLFFLSTTYAIYTWGADLPAGLLFYTLTIIMSGILISTRFAFITTLIISLSLISITYLQDHNIVNPDLYWMMDMAPEISDAIITAIIFLIIATISWLSNREIEKSLIRARKSEKELKKERDMLEIRVLERTKELQKTQMEKMAEIYKFAEFGRLSSGLFHDLINPLNAISLNIEKIKKNNGDIEEIENDLERTIKVTDRMKIFINSIKKQMIHTTNKEFFSLNEEIKEAIEILKYRIRKHNIEITFDYSEELELFGSAMKINQVMVNLINNAIDSGGNKIKINTTRRSSNIIISIIDNGSGIAEDIQSKIFEPFFTTKNFEKTDSGTGIGLSLSKRIIEKDFRGSISLDNKQRTGSKFIIEIPIKNE